MVAGICAGAVAAAVLASGAADGGTRDHTVRVDGRFAPPAGGTAPAAVTYDEKLVPAGSRIEVRQHVAGNGATTVELRVTGMKPGHTYGVHVHRAPCGADPAAAGGHYQHRPSTDPADANPENEVWLDFTADARGAGRASARHDWGFRRGEASSVILHDEPGNAGTRAACFTVPFAGTG
ncbi:superoxide dismutase family protein [Streptomyces sp. NPDC006134]|uniref:superoxide dismutase family protein n=1 Tax=Streptomyces sp. NPDC006134 TaxID=3154467 RepID=UPI0034098C89